MNKLFLVLIAVLTCFSCTSNTSKGEYVINGTINNLGENTQILLIHQQNNGVEKIDTTIVKDGKFSFTGIQKEPEIYIISVNNLDSIAITDPMFQVLLIEPGKILVDVVDNTIKVSGTPANDSFHERTEAEKQVFKLIENLEQQYASVDFSALSAEETEKINQQFRLLGDSIKTINLNFATQNINNPLGENVFLSIANILSLEELEKVMNDAGDTFKSKETGKAILSYIEETKKTSIGQKFIDFAMHTPNGKVVSLSDYAGKGKYVLIYFWASWCGPCRQEIPNLANAYKLYKDKNFEIVGVSLDNNADMWKDGIKNNNMTWVQMSDLRQQSQAMELYNFNSIPHMVLLDPAGIIIEKDLRGGKLLEKLQELIK